MTDAVAWPKAMLLDLDDTILAFDAVADSSWVAVLQRNSGELTGHSVTEVLQSIKSAARRFWRDPERHRIGRMDLMWARRNIVADALSGMELPGDDGLVNQIAIAYDEERTAAIHPIPGALETVQAMKETGVKLALITNGAAAPQQEKIDRFGLVPLFDCILIEGACGVGKPDERVYQMALSVLGVSAEDAWMAGDNWEWEVAAPQRLGIRGIWVNANGSKPPDDGVTAFRIVRRLEELRA